MASSSVVVKVVERIADREGVDPVDLDTPLHAVVDADALESITSGRGESHPSAGLRVEFTYYGYSVTVDGSGAVTIGGKPSPIESGETS